MSVQYIVQLSFLVIVLLVFSVAQNPKTSTVICTEDLPEIEEEEIMKALKPMKNGKAAGADDILPEMLKATGWENLITKSNSSSVVPFKYYGNKSYYFGIYIKASYLQAMQFCETVHMKLLSIQDEEENRRIHTFILDQSSGSRFWTSGSKVLDGQTFIWMSYLIPVEYTNWGPEQPSNDRYKQCLQIEAQSRNLIWNSFNCDAQGFFICERYEETPHFDNQANKSSRGNLDSVQGRNLDLVKGGFSEVGVKISNSTVVTKTGPTDDSAFEDAMRKSPPGEISIRQFGGKKYHVEIKLLGTHSQANQFCAYHNMQLVEINNAEETRFLEAVLLDTGASGPYWTAGKRIGDSWVWTGSFKLVLYTYWNRNMPRISSPSRDCIESDDLAKWNNQYCNKRLFFICEAEMYPNKIKLQTPNERNEENGQCSQQPVVNVYINTNLISDTGKDNLNKEILTSKEVSDKDGSYQVQVTNNIDLAHKDEHEQVSLEFRK